MAAGKGACCQYLADRYGARSHRFSAILRDILDRVRLPHTRENLQLASSTLRQAFGDDLMAKAIAQDVAADRGRLATVDGIRRWLDIKHLLPINGFHLIAVTAKERTRFNRLKRRKENPDDAKKTFRDFVRDGNQEAELQISRVVSRAEFKVDNNGTLEELYRQLDRIVNKFT
jgi:dephospho-CoA kinase